MTDNAAISVNEGVSNPVEAAAQHERRSEGYIGGTCAILLNDRAGALHATAGREEIESLAKEIGLEAEVIGTTSVEHMQETLRRLVREGRSKVAVAGGDGTVALAVQELAHTDTALGILPQGTANNFATALRLPLELPMAMRLLHDGVVRSVDVGRVTASNGRSRYFTEAAGVGIFADILALYGQGTNKNLGRAVWSTLSVLLHLRARRLLITLDGERFAERAVFCAVANSYRMARGVPVAPDAKVTDGELDVVVAGNLRPVELLTYYRAFRAQTHPSLPKITTARAKKIRIETHRPANVHCDDRVVGTTPVDVEVQPGALRVLVDRI